MRRLSQVLHAGIGDSTFPILDVVPAEDIFPVGHIFSFAAVGWSMFPTIQEGDLLIWRTRSSLRWDLIAAFSAKATLPR